MTRKFDQGARSSRVRLNANNLLQGSWGGRHRGLFSVPWSPKLKTNFKSYAQQEDAEKRKEEHPVLVCIIAGTCNWKSEQSVFSRPPVQFWPFADSSQYYPLRTAMSTVRIHPLAVRVRMGRVITAHFP